MIPFLTRLRAWIRASGHGGAHPTVDHDRSSRDRFASISDIGLQRASNQDTVLVRPELGLWVVADGMGGHAGGAEASRIACEAVSESVENGLSLPDAFEVAHARVRFDQQENADRQDMGTTLVAMHEQGPRIELAWVGDSRAYRFERDSGRLECLTRDHNIAGRLLAAGSITAEQARNHPQRNILTDCIGQREGLPEIEHQTHQWRPGDWWLLCTDGLSGEVPEETLTEILAISTTPADAAERLLAAALETGGRDNISLIVLATPES